MSTPVETLIPTIPLIEELLDEFGLLHQIDDDGDLTVRWDSFTVYFFQYGDQKEVLQARAYVDRRLLVEQRASIVMWLDEWHRTRMAPKAYTTLPDDGLLGVCAEISHDFEKGATREQIALIIGTWLSQITQFAQWFDGLVVDAC